MRLGVDDTDSPQGGCTTWVLTEIVRAAGALGFDVLGEPRLVRLNPNVPWKTRGNAALSVRLGHGEGSPTTVGEIDGRPVRSFRRGRELSDAEVDRLLHVAWDVVRSASPSAPGTDPALVLCRRPLAPSTYWQAVREVVPVTRVLRELRRRGATYRLRSGRRGLVGAAAAVAWPGRRRTWELLAYRQRSRVGTPRLVDPESVLDAERAEPSLVLCHDPRTRRLLVAPHTRCPILFGLRATDPGGALRALARIRSEPIERWMLFRTNQGTGDHLVRRTVAGLAAHRSAVVRGSVDGPAERRPGGHVSFPLRDDAGDRLTCVAFEPTKTLPAVARALVPGDRLEVWGSRGRAGVLHLEGIRVLAVADRRRWRAPTCGKCGGTTRSLGAGRGWRCPRCRGRFPLEAGRRVVVAHAPALGSYHPTPSARRHLAPLAV